MPSARSAPGARRARRGCRARRARSAGRRWPGRRRARRVPRGRSRSRRAALRATSARPGFAPARTAPIGACRAARAGRAAARAGRRRAGHPLSSAARACCQARSAGSAAGSSCVLGRRSRGTAGSCRCRRRRRRWARRRPMPRADVRTDSVDARAPPGGGPLAADAHRPAFRERGDPSPLPAVRALCGRSGRAAPADRLRLAGVVAAAKLAAEHATGGLEPGALLAQVELAVAAAAVDPPVLAALAAAPDRRRDPFRHRVASAGDGCGRAWGRSPRRRPGRPSGAPGARNSWSRRVG